jgi:thioredoxin 2
MFPLMNTLVCPTCFAVNRADPARLAQAVCGKCGLPLAGGHAPLHLDPASFERFLTRDGLPLLVDFWAPWCGPCRMMAPAFEQAAALLGPGLRLGKVNTEEHQALGARLGVQSIPTLVLFQGGRETARQSGAMPAQQIVAWVRQQLANR